jgi:hypothetical protein
MMVWVCVTWSDWRPSDCNELLSAECVYNNLDWIKFWVTLLLVPFVLYETIKHWCSGTYFPMTYSDSFHEAFYGEKVDMMPGSVRRGTLVAMVIMGICLSLVSLANFLTVILKLCPNSNATCEDEYHGLTSTLKLILWLQVAMYFVALLLRMKSLFFITLFTVAGTMSFMLLGVLTFGIAWIVICCLFSNGGIRRAREGQCCGCIANGVYNFIAFFYTRV